jgi:phosphoribosyl-ATP pyrophosphohydrolase/phosphoribosyl-AMP cyclohydrolase/histidinol dehydrogenase
MPSGSSPTSAPLFPRLAPGEVMRSHREPVDPQTLERAAAIIEDVRSRGWDAVLEHARSLGDLADGSPPIYTRMDLARALDRIDRATRSILEDAAARISYFAQAQAKSLVPVSMRVDGLEVGHTIAPVERAGCYAPGGRFPLPSSVLMTVCTARAAGVREVWAASPKPQPATLAAAAIAGSDGLLAIGGAQAIAAFAYGAGPINRCDTIVGPGNRWVTAAKKIIAGTVAIDMLAGPSEVLIIADDSADPQIVAADLLAQAEHDTDASAWLVTTSNALADGVDLELDKQLATLPSASIARESLRNGGTLLCTSMDEAIMVSDRLAPEHLEIMTRDADAVAARCSHYGAIFIGEGAAEVVGDYGIGPNHTLPTGGASRFVGGLSVLNFMRVRTFVRSSGRAVPAVYERTAAFARIEGLEAHARAAEARTRG